MKYLMPTVLMGAAVCPYVGLPWYFAVPVFATGAFFGLIAYGTPDVPLAFSTTENYFGDDCCGD